MATKKNSPAAAESNPANSRHAINVPLSDLRAGADAVHELLKRLAKFGEYTCDHISLDGRDYRAMCETVEASLRVNVNEASAPHREGYMRALTDLLSHVADGCLPSDHWNPLANTSDAFAQAPHPIAA